MIWRERSSCWGGGEFFYWGGVLFVSWKIFFFRLVEFVVRAVERDLGLL